MAVQYFTPKTYEVLKMYVTLTHFETAGDSLRYAFDKTDTVPVVNSSNYFEKQMIIAGSVTVEFPGMDVITAAPGYIWPEDNINYNVDSAGVPVTAIEDNTRLYCVHPYPGDTLDINRVTVSSGDNHTISTGTIALVFGNSFTVNGNASADNPKILVCQNNDAVIAAASECNIVKFTVTQ